MATFYQYLLAIIFALIQSAYIIVKGYFLSIEFTLYPYLIKNNFTPYKDIVDQHFPSLFFGFFSLPLLSQKSHIPLLVLLIGLNFFSGLLLYRYLLHSGSKKATLHTAIYLIIMSYFSANILWVEIFINFIIVLILNLDYEKYSYLGYLIGFLLFQVILMRPTLVFTVLVLSLYVFHNYKNILIGLFFGFVTTLCYFLINKNLLDFFQVAIKFNYSVYSVAGSIAPSARQILSVLVVIVFLFLHFPRSKKEVIWFAIALLSLLSAYPRFGLEHLQPFVLLTIIYISQSTTLSTISNTYAVFIIVFFVAQLILGLTKSRYGNYFYPPSLSRVAEEIRSFPQDNLYLFGATDLLYPLSDRLPPQKTYIPSLPWYLGYQTYQSKLFKSLESSNTLILVDKDFSVDGQKLVTEVPEIYEYIKMNYNLLKTIETIEFYSKKNENSN